MAQTLLYLVSEDWYFVSHRLPMARAAQAAGFEVHVATRVDKHGDSIRAEGFTLHPVAWRRGSLNPFRLLATVREIRALYRRLRPDLVHHVALVPSVLGSIAALGLPMAKLNAFAGLGFAFTSATAKARAIRAVAAPLLRCLLNRPATAVLVQNPDDREAVLDLGVPPDAITLIPGSGIDVETLQPLPEPDGIFTVAFVGRLLDDKGVRPLVRAHELLAARGIAVRLLRRVRDFCEAEGARIDRKGAAMSLARLEVDEDGLDALDRRYLQALMKTYSGGPVGADTLAAALSEARDAIEEVIEPYLMQQGFVARTPRGRVATPKAWERIGLKPPSSFQTPLFEESEPDT